ncbi:hypothetical protein L1987_54114 [Smallanthus sonchifolius]|uniref:Uncharacterized protein n=1 Tax=Smallanthus sonchifolius TaxID=185202 RepID=A0ACB9E7G3_9ASTR|nr:hypothetical protein L1987_54114 [Smallanthus sonchifolius]
MSFTRFDVYLNFRGEDTGHSFTDHLYTALKGAAIRTFRDAEDVESGEDFSHETVKAIENSRGSIVVLSETYAYSTWCLDELSLILEQRRKRNHFVLPVFYHVEPSDVRKQRCSFAIQGSKGTEENVNRWKFALTDVANFSGFVASGSEADLIARIVDTVESRLDRKRISPPPALSHAMFQVPENMKIPLDVFLSFRGEDTGHSFTDHLYTALKGAAIRTFRDDLKFERGQDFKHEMVKAIGNSRGSIVVFSENYAESSWCLEDLSFILEQRRKGNHFVLPVFYKVDPSYVRNKLRSVVKERPSWTQENMNRWNSALREFAYLTGFVASGSEAKLIAKIVDAVEYKLKLLSHHESLQVPERLKIPLEASTINTNNIAGTSVYLDPEYDRTALEFQEEYETRKANLDETYKEMLHEFSECPEAYSAMREKNIYSILSKRFLLEHDKSMGSQEYYDVISSDDNG